jgi:hypothetical protein
MNSPLSFFRCLCFSTALVVVVSVALFIFVATPLRAKIAEESDAIQKIHAKIEHADRKISRLPEIETQFSTLKEDERKMSRILSEAQAVDFIEEIEEIAKSLGGEVSITQGSAMESVKKKPTPKSEEGNVEKKVPESKTIAGGLSWEKRLALKVEFLGEYSKSVSFLHRVETMSYRLDVISISMRPSVPENDLQRSGDVFAMAQTEGLEPPTPVEPEKPLVSAAFDVVVYIE